VVGDKITIMITATMFLTFKHFISLHCYKLPSNNRRNYKGRSENGSIAKQQLKSNGFYKDHTSSTTVKVLIT